MEEETSHSERDEEKDDGEKSPSQGSRKQNENFLNRSSNLVRHASKRGYAVMALFLLVLAGIAVVLVSGGKKHAVTLQQEEEFEVSTKRGPVIPKPVLSAPQPTALPDKIDKEAMALKDARLKSAIVIYQNNSSERPQNADQAPKAGSADPNQRFQEQAQAMGVPSSQAVSLEGLDTKILQGKIIDAVMETAINSDLPGMVRAIISYDVFGESGRNVLLPRGSRLVGQYNSAVRKGQARVFVIWNRAIRPDGIEIAINSGGADTLGRSGMEGEVNRHFWQIFGTSALLSIIGSGAAIAGAHPSDQNNSLSAYREELANSFRDSATQVLNSSIDIPPTIKVEQGTRMKVFVARDLDFSAALSRAQGFARGTTQSSWVYRL